METSIFRYSRAANSVFSGQMWLTFELIQALMRVHITCKYQKDRIKKQARKSGDTIFPIISLWSDLSKFELTLDIMHSLVTFKSKIDQINSNREKVETMIFKRSRTANAVVSIQILTKFELIKPFNLQVS